jgi:hypothetical protein
MRWKRPFWGCYRNVLSDKCDFSCVCVRNKSLLPICFAPENIHTPYQNQQMHRFNIKEVLCCELWRCNGVRKEEHPAAIGFYCHRRILLPLHGSSN